MSTHCSPEPIRFRHLGDYTHSRATLYALHQAHAAIELAGTWVVRRRRRRTLGTLARLGERTILDLGFDPDELRLEASKPFWRE